MKKGKDNKEKQGVVTGIAGKTMPSADLLVQGIRKGDTTMLARAITLVESDREEDRERAYALMERCLPYRVQSVRIGITGVPGVGKSTFIEALGAILTAKGRKVAVLAVDPSSSMSHGSIMGDKTRMPGLVKNPLAFIRPSPAGGSLGGVARSTRETVMLCEAAGYEIILIETVGVGQSEIKVHSMADFFLLLQLAGAGDELQGIKRGIVEMADVVVINKADGDNVQRADEARAAFERALHLYPPKENGWIPEVLCCSAIENKGISEIWDLIVSFTDRFRASGYLESNRGEQNKYWFRQTVELELARHFYTSPVVREQLAGFMVKVEKNEISPFRAATLLVQAYQGGN